MDPIQSGDIEALEEIAAADSDFPVGRDDFLGETWLSTAIASGNVDTVKWMLDRGADPNYQADDGYPSFHTALEVDPPARHKILELLCGAGADLTMRGLNDWTPLHMAAARDDPEAVRILLSHGARTDLRTRIDEYATPYEEAHRLGAKAAVDAMRNFNKPAWEFHCRLFSVALFRPRGERKK
jgi:ankyrin repeat protein